MMGFWDAAFMIYISVASMVFVACYPFGVVLTGARARFMQCFTALLSAIFWPIPVVLFLVAVGYVMLLFMMSLVVERR